MKANGTKSKAKILLFPTQEVMEVNLPVVDFFRVVSSLKDGGFYQPQVSLWDDELKDWTGWYETIDQCCLQKVK